MFVAPTPAAPPAAPRPNLLGAPVMGNMVLMKPKFIRVIKVVNYLALCSFHLLHP